MIYYQQKINQTYLDVDHDQYGRRKYLSLQNVYENLKQRTTLKLFNLNNRTFQEGEIKRDECIIIVAQYSYGKEDFSSLNDFTVIDDYSFGKNLMILSNASCLMDSKLNNIEIFKNLKLIVNCQTTEPVKYKVNTQKAIFYAVHELAFSKKDTNVILDQINVEIWNASREGTVVIHCLAGMHRAPCIMISQVLYRYYVQNQKYLDIDFQQIYKKLSSIRSGVAPLSYIELLIKYKDYLSKKY